MPSKRNSGPSIYTSLVQKACRCDTQRAQEIESEMRAVHGTLDSLSLPQFTAAAKRAEQRTREMKALPGTTALEKLEIYRASLYGKA